MDDNLAEILLEKHFKFLGLDVDDMDMAEYLACIDAIKEALNYHLKISNNGS